MNVWGTKHTFRMVVSEPEPGRVLVETDREAGGTTTFTVEPLKDGRQTRVTIATDVTASPGFRGFMEKLVNPPVTRHIYKKELRQLAEYVRRKAEPQSGSD